MRPIFIFKWFLLTLSCVCGSRNGSEPQILATGVVALNDGHAQIKIPEMGIDWAGAYVWHAPTKPVVLPEFTANMHAELYFLPAEKIRLDWWKTGEGIYSCECKILQP